MRIKRRTFIINLSAAILFPYSFLNLKNDSIKIVNGWMLKSEDF